MNDLLHHVTGCLQHLAATGEFLLAFFGVVGPHRGRIVELCDDLGRLREVIDDVCRVFCRLVGIFVRAQQQAGLDAGVEGGLQIAGLVAERHRCGHVDRMLARSAQEHAGIRLAVLGLGAVFADAVFRVRGAVIDVEYRHALGLEACAHPGCKGLELFLGELSAADAGLVGDDDDVEAAHDRVPAQVEDARHELEPLGRVDVTVIDVDHAVAVEEDGPDAIHAENPEKSCCARR